MIMMFDSMVLDPILCIHRQPPRCPEVLSAWPWACWGKPAALFVASRDCLALPAFRRHAPDIPRLETLEASWWNLSSGKLYEVLQICLFASKLRRQLVVIQWQCTCPAAVFEVQNLYFFSQEPLIAGAIAAAISCLYVFMIGVSFGSHGHSYIDSIWISKYYHLINHWPTSTN